MATTKPSYRIKFAVWPSEVPSTMTVEARSEREAIDVGLDILAERHPGVTCVVWASKAP